MEVQDEIQDDGPSDGYLRGSHHPGNSDSSPAKSRIPRQSYFRSPEESLAALTLDSGAYFASAARQLSSMPYEGPQALQLSLGRLPDATQYPEEEDDVLTDLNVTRLRSLASKSSRFSRDPRINQRRHSVSPVKSLSSLARTTNMMSGTTSGKPWRTPSLPFMPPFLNVRERPIDG
jgi:hypothetical protein